MTSQPPMPPRRRTQRLASPGRPPRHIRPEGDPRRAAWTPRLVGDDTSAAAERWADPLRQAGVGVPITQAGDPRWVLAVHTAQALEGAIITLDKRHRLIRLGAALGLSPFDANLIVAIIQDQARRGHTPLHCPTAGCDQLEMVPLPAAHHDAARRRILQTAWLVAGVLAVEIVIFTLWLVR